MARRALVAGLTALLVAGCGGGGGAADVAETPTPTPSAKAASPTPSPTAEPARNVDEVSGLPDEDLLYALLRERAAHLEHGDVWAYKMTGTGRQRKLDRKFGRRVVGLGLQRIRISTDDLTTSGDRATFRAVLSYRVKGMSRPFLTPRRVEARRTPHGWRISRDRPVNEPLPWEVSKLRATRSRHIVLLAPPGVDAGPLRSGLEDAYREIRRDLPSRDLPRSVLVLAPRDARQGSKLAGARVAPGVLAMANVAVEWGAPPAYKVERVLAQRLLVVMSRWEGLSPEEREATLVHEMTHTALDPDTSARMPPWLAEGVAMYVSNDDRTPEARARAAGAAKRVRLHQISKPGSIFKLRGSAQGAAYAASSAAAHVIVAEHGNKGLFGLYDAFKNPKIPGKPGAKTTNRVLRRTLGMTLTELDEAAHGG